MIPLLVICLCGVTIDAFLITSSKPSEVCYGDLGCFSNAAPFKSSKRPSSFLPKSPQEIKTSFLLYTRANPTSDKEETLSVSDPASFSKSHYDPTHPTKFIVHGFTHNGHKQWIQNMKTELLKNAEMNVIIVDWGIGAALPYGQASANTRLVGAQVGQLMNYILNNTNSESVHFHIIGHSLGAHVAGYAGEIVKDLGRISGLDPAEPFFEDTPPQVRLDPTDASFVDVIHTDDGTILSLGMGAKQAMGHVDFYINGGSVQPGCDTNVLSKLTHTVWNGITLGYYGAEAAVACSHERSYALYTESINSGCPFMGFPCTGADDFNRGRCLSCLGNQCSKMGYHADASPGRGSLFLNTQASSPFCSYHYMVNISSDNEMDGIVKVTLHGTGGDTSVIPLMKSNEVVNSGKVVTHLVSAHQSIGNITGITVSYDKTSSFLVGWMYPDDWKLMGISVLEGETQQTTTFCAYGKDVMSHSHSDFKVTGHCS
ncbi:pancreatic lipase-related protein 2-like [Haliotis cracherodii]|uniref:pancreatic lipase-related protein 2-like n=1 Tax=Haliotis cracherodii TaxID=6455 RepID=UPI0039ED42B5